MSVADEARQALARVQADLRAELGPDARLFRWTRPEQFHLTLAFLGTIADPALAVACLERTVMPTSFLLRFTGLSAFPNPNRAQVVWAGLTEGAGDLRAIAHRLRSELVTSGFSLDDRELTPHLTLARAKGRPRRLRAVLDRVPIEPITDRATEVVLYESQLGSEGAVHRRIAAVSL